MYALTSAAATHAHAASDWWVVPLLLILVGILVGRFWGRWAGLKQLGKYEFRGRWANINKIRKW